MKTTYQATFALRSRDRDGADVFDSAARMCIDWALDRPRAERPQALSQTADLGTMAQAEVAPDTWVETILDIEGGRRLWGLRLTHVDSDDATVRWLTELGLKKEATTDETFFSCVLGFNATKGMLRRVVRSPSRPRVVPKLLNAFEGLAGLPMTATPWVITENDVREFVDILLNRERRRPVIFVSCENFKDRPVVDAVQIANQLAGLAHVVVTRSRFPSFKLNERIPASLGCWDGAVRLYWPGFSREDSQFTHPVWSRRWIRDADHDQEFPIYVLGRLSDVAVSVLDPEAVTFDVLEAARRDKLIESHRRSGETEELVRLYADDKQSLQMQVEELKRERAELVEQRDKAQAEARSWREAYVENVRGAPSEGSPQQVEDLPRVKSVEDAVEGAKRLFADRIVIKPNSRSLIKNNPFERPQELLQALQFLAGTFHDAKTGKVPCNDLDQALREACGWSYEAKQSKITMGLYADWYQTIYESRPIALPMHVGTGSSKEARYTIRVAFNWDDNKNIVVVGFIGQHQETGAT